MESLRDRFGEVKPKQKLYEVRDDRELLEEGFVWEETRAGKHGIDISKVRFRWMETRDLTAGSGVGGGFLVGSKSPFPVIEYLGSQLVTKKAGALALPVDSLGPVPKVAGITSAGWIAEGGGVSEPNFTFGSAPLSAKTVAAFADVSRLLNAQAGPIAEGVVTRELLGANARALDAAVLNGTGNAGQPLGVAGTIAVDVRSGATYSLAIAAAQLKTIETGNADSSMAAWIMDPASAEILRQRPKAMSGERMLLEGAEMLGLPAYVSNSVSEGFIFLGVWSEIVIPTLSIEVLRNPFSQSKSGYVELGCYWVGDLIVRHPACFSVANSVS